MENSSDGINNKQSSENVESILNLLKGFIGCILMFVILTLYYTNPNFFEENMIYIIFLISLNVFNFVIPKKIGFYNDYKYAQKFKELEIKNKVSKYLKAKAEKKFGEFTGDLTLYIISFLDLFKVPLPDSIALISMLINNIQANSLFILPLISGIIGSIVLLFNVSINEISKLNLK
tara:strand:- start:8835 stop:9362 length:528 start_codon:yes stop_codon:yes gene_type:complete